LKLNPFAGSAEREVAFEPGLNVILGPNEAGKSTLLKALRMILFVQTNSDKRIFDREIKQFMPVSGGDTINVNLHFQIATEEYDLTRSWGNLKESKLRLPGGGLLTDEWTIQNKIRELLVLNEGTFNSVLFADQSSLTYTFNVLNENAEASEELSAILEKQSSRLMAFQLKNLARE
jgi:exonuclease SbcC